MGQVAPETGRLDNKSCSFFIVIFGVVIVFDQLGSYCWKFPECVWGWRQAVRSSGGPVAKS
jgi:hypothetical protein